MRVIAFLFLSLFSLSANPYFQILEALNEEKGDFLQDEIEIVKDKEKIKEIECLQAQRYLRKGYTKEEAKSFSKVGIIGEDTYVLWIRDAVTFPSGYQSTYNRFLWKNNISCSKNHPSIAALPVTEDGKVILILIYRHATRSWEVELPRGRRKPAQDLYQALSEDLLQEIGGEVTNYSLLGTVSPDTGILGSVIAVFFAKIRMIESPQAEETTSIRKTLFLTVDEVKKCFKQGHIEVDGRKVSFRDPFLAYAFLQASLRDYFKN